MTVIVGIPVKDDDAVLCPPENKIFPVLGGIFQIVADKAPVIFTQGLDVLDSPRCPEIFPFQQLDLQWLLIEKLNFNFLLNDQFWLGIAQRHQKISLDFDPVLLLFAFYLPGIEVKYLCTGPAE